MPTPGPRVLVLATTFPASAGDGTPEFVLTLSQELVKQGARVTVVTPRVPGGRRVDVIDDVSIRRFRYFPSRWEDLADGAIVPNLKARPSRWLQVIPLVFALWWVGRREARRVRADVIHAHWIVPAAFVARLLRRPYVVTAHGADAYALTGGVFDLAKKFALSRAVSVVPVSEAIGDRLAQLGCRPHAAVPMGVDIGSIEVLVGHREPVPGRVLFVGRLVDKKGIDDLIRSLVDVPQAHLRIVGDGPSRTSLEALASAEGVANRVQFLGRQPRQGVFTEMRSASVVALPSKVGAGGDEDGVPVALAEAMAAGVPIVASDAGGLSEHVIDGRTGWLVQAASVRQLASALQQALSDPVEAGRRAGEAKVRMAETLDVEHIGETYLRLIRAAVRR